MRHPDEKITDVPFFSLIVPVYNVAPYLKACLDSISRQTYPNFEVICVNDGSTDESGDILEKYACQDKRFNVYYQKNTGPGAARNLALSKANGRYLLFIDADDWLENTALERLYKVIQVESPDLIWFNYFDESQSGAQKGTDICLNDKSQITTFFMDYYAKLWNKAFRADFVRAWGKLFHPTRLFLEDADFNIPLIIAAQKTAFISDYLYHHLIRGDSLSSRQWSDELFDIFVPVLQQYRKAPVFDEFAQVFLRLSVIPIQRNKASDGYIDQLIQQIKKFELTGENVARVYTLIRNNNPMFSIILPVYNNEKYLVKCLNSMKDQPFSDFEVICVNDGSTDESGDILDRYADRDKRFRVFHTKNRGPGAARNLALTKVQGKYVLFIDADDYFADNALKVLNVYVEKNKPDLLFFAHDRIDSKTGCVIYSNKKRLDAPLLKIGKLTLINETDMLQYENTSAWGKVFDRTLIDRLSLKFSEKIRFGEDVLFSLPALLYARKMAFLNQVLYTYRDHRSGSLTEQKNLNDLFVVKKELQQKYRLNLFRFYYVQKWACSFVCYLVSGPFGWLFFMRLRYMSFILSRAPHLFYMQQSTSLQNLNEITKLPYLYVRYYRRPVVWNRLSRIKRVLIYIALLPFFIRRMHQLALRKK